MTGARAAGALLLWLTATGSAHAGTPRSVAVLEYRAGVTVAAGIGEHLAALLQGATSLRVVGPDEARRRLAGHADGLVARCGGEAACLAEIGRRLGTDEVVLIGLSQLGDLIVAMQRIDSANGRVEGRIAESLARDREPDEEALTDLLRRLMPPDDFVRYGTVRVRSDVPGAMVLVDGRPAGQTPLADLRVLAPRKVNVRVEKSGYAPFQATLDVLPGTVAEVAPELPPEAAAPSWYKRWWVWAIVGGVAAGTATAVAFTRGGDSSVNLVINPPMR